MARIEAQAKGGYYPTPDVVTEHIAGRCVSEYVRHTERRSNEHRLLDPCCGTGRALKSIAEGLAGNSDLPVRTFGVELHSGRAEEAAMVLDEAIEGDLMRVSISHEAFDMCYLNPPYDLEADGTGKRIELSFLQKCTPYIAPRGLLILIVPAHTVRRMSKHLSSWYHNLKLWPFPEEEYAAYKQVVITGIKRHAPSNYRSEGEGLCYDAAQVEGSTPEEVLPELRITHHKVQKVQFQTIFFDPFQLSEEAGERGIWKSAKVNDALWPVEDTESKPLLPLRQGHLAILAAAGFLNNRVLEDENGGKVLAKGQSYKEMVVMEETADKVRSREIQRTKVMKLDLATGEFHRIQA